MSIIFGARRTGRSLSAGQFVVAVAVVSAAFTSIYLRRLNLHFSNVDDFLYAKQAPDLRSAHGPIEIARAWRSSSSNSPLVPSLAAVLGGSPNRMVLVQFPLLLTLLFFVRVLLGQLGTPSWFAAAAVVVAGPVLSYAGMLSFAVAATTLTVGALALSFASEGLTHRAITVLFGVDLGLLSLSRVVAPVYIVAILVVVVRSRRVLLPLAVGTAVAAPWWIIAGPSAVKYLLTAGYDQSGGQAGTQGLSRVLGRFAHTSAETGVCLFVLVSLAVVVALTQRGPMRETSAVVLVTMLFLGTSSNAGTAFALPAVTLAMCCLVAQSRVMVAPLLMSSILLVSGLSGPWLSELPSATQLRDAVGATPTDTQEIALEVLHVVGGRRALLVREDAALNANELTFLRPSLLLSVPDFSAKSAALGDFQAVITGTTGATYLPLLSATSWSSELAPAGFRMMYQHRYGPTGDVQVWVRS